MLIEFTVGNFRSIKEPVTLSMAAAKLSSRSPELDANNSFQVNNDLTLLKSAAIYGANASGKSNVVKALAFMRWLVKNSSKESQIHDPINTTPFRLDAETEQEPSFFEVVFLLEDIPYRYGFEVTQEKVETEWLFYSPHGKEAKLFVREGDEITLSRAYQGVATAKTITRPNALFVSVAAQFNGETAIKVLNWFESIGIISGLDDDAYHDFTAKVFSEDPTYREQILELVRNSDVGINDVIAEKVNINDPSALPSKLSEGLKDYLLKKLKNNEHINFKSSHYKTLKNGSVENTLFDMEEESEGTQKLFYLSGPVVDILVKGGVLVIDEIEARMHTLLTRRLIGLFNSEKTNLHYAQLIFATHDTNLLSNKIFRRDQIWFMEKDDVGASHLYSLAELKVRNDASFESDYLQGKYGAIPILGEMRHILIDLEAAGNHEGE